MSSFTIGYETSDGVKRFYIIFNKISWYIEDNNGSKYLTLIPVHENKGAIKMYKEISNEIKYRSGLENNGSGDYDDKYMKIKLDLDEDFPWKRN